ncbi:MAG: hypothetical protein ACYC6C_11920, partial [Coriobacteriia bacterium]
MLQMQMRGVRQVVLPLLSLLTAAVLSGCGSATVNHTPVAARGADQASRLAQWPNDHYLSKGDWIRILPKDALSFDLWTKAWFTPIQISPSTFYGHPVKFRNGRSAHGITYFHDLSSASKQYPDSAWCIGTAAKF